MFPNITCANGVETEYGYELLLILY